MFENLAIEGLKLVTPTKHKDERGFFCETHNAPSWEKVGLHYNFVQDNHSMSRDVGTVRGLHFQREPFEQDKLVRVVRGCILDVALDIRPSSPTYGKHVAVRLSEQNWRQLFIPKGFAHGFITLEPNTEVIYKVTNFYSPTHELGIAWDDPELGIEWGIRADQVLLSDRDRKWPRLRDLGEAFT